MFKCLPSVFEASYFQFDAASFEAEFGTLEAVFVAFSAALGAVFAALEVVFAVLEPAYSCVAVLPELAGFQPLPHFAVLPVGVAVLGVAAHTAL